MCHSAECHSEKCYGTSSKNVFLSFVVKKAFDKRLKAPNVDVTNTFWPLMLLTKKLERFILKSLFSPV
jgi:hypothetical protein